MPTPSPEAGIPPFSETDHAAMARALQLAERGLYSTSPNPRVGCVLLRDGGVVGEGWHERAGAPHAEVHALRAAGERARGATAYVTLEPCAHHGRTPPCADALLAAGVARVVAAMEDPNPLVAGRGLARLAGAGVAVRCGLLGEAARELNVGFVSRMSRGRPWLRVKCAASLDGRTALSDGRSQWITGPEARRDGHRWRARACAILTGAGTVATDDPRLDVREVPTPRQPLRVVVDSHLRLPPHARLFGGGGPVLVACVAAPEERAAALRARGAEVMCLPAASGGGVDLEALCRELGRRGCNEVHVEAGGVLSGALVRAGLVDEFLCYVAPCLIGDVARGAFSWPGLPSLDAAVRLRWRDVRQVGDDLRVIARPVCG